MSDPNQPDENSPDAGDPDDQLDADQQKAFESIMAQIENGDADADDDSEDPAEFSAELEKVVKQAEAGTDGDTGESDADEALDDDQQKAFESIMAQIEGGDEQADDTVPPDDPTTDDAVDVSAELEKVAQQAEAEEPGTDGDAGESDADEALDDDQQKALESIMAQIEGGDEQVADTDSSDEPTADDTDNTSAELEEVAPQTTADALGNRSDNSAGSQTDELANQKETHPEAADDLIMETLSGDAQSSETDDKTEKMRTDEKDTGSSSSMNAMPKVGADHQPLKTPAEITPENQPPAASAKKPAPPPKKAAPSSGNIKKGAIIAWVVVAIALMGIGYSLFFQTKDGHQADSTQNGASEQPAASIEVSSPNQLPGQDIVPGANTVLQDDSDLARLKAVASSLNRLRDELINKQSEIEELRSYYRAGMDAEIQDMVKTIRASENARMPYSAAKGDPRFMLGLTAIQRRDTYVQKLVTPVAALNHHIEALLYFSRKAELLALMAAQTSDIDVDGFISEAENSMAAYRQAMTELNIDTVPATPRPLTSIWQDVIAALPATPVLSGGKGPTAAVDNVTIWKEMCAGDYAHKHQLTDLSPEAARCLASWKGKDLFLNSLADLSPEAARHLATWEGDWLGLNGLTDLKPEVALPLSRWKGKGLSLNGLTRLSPRVVAILSEWQGRQIELINVKHMAHWENPNTRLFLSDAMQRKQTAKRN